MPFRLLPLAALPEDFALLRAGAAAEGFRFLDRLAQDWETGGNRFDGAGEVLLGARAADSPRDSPEDGALLGLCGLNRDPYTAGEEVGRLRHLYVRPGARRRGVASALVACLLRHAAGSFHTVRLRTDTADAALFYQRHGFRPVVSAEATHQRRLR